MEEKSASSQGPMERHRSWHSGLSAAMALECLSGSSRVWLKIEERDDQECA